MNERVNVPEIFYQEVVHHGNYPAYTTICHTGGCHKLSTVRMSFGNHVGYYCDRHVGEFGGMFIDQAWPWLKPLMEEEGEL